jgi:uncharacterized protein YbaP (TraB family)
MYRVFLLLLPACIVFTLNTRAFAAMPAAGPGPANHAPAIGLLWEISGNGLHKPGYLYGTMHVSEKMVFNLSDSFFLALHQVDMVALETNHDEWQDFTERLVSSGAQNPFGGNGYGMTNYRNHIPNLYSESFLFTPPTRELLGAMLSVKPVMTNEYLYRSNESQQDYEEDTYLDLFIFQAGKKLGKKVIGLETSEGSYESVMRARIPDDQEREKKSRSYPPTFSRLSLEEAYRSQDLQLIDSINQMNNPGKNFRRWMLDERNIIMANRIDSVLRSGTSIFSAVGAAHLPGNEGVINLLRRKGYSLRPVQFTNTRGNTEKEKIDKIHFPVVSQRHWLSDSTWSAETPGRLFSSFRMQEFEQHLCADMSNGVYYAVYRLKTSGWWAGQSPAYIAERLDSLIYEKIPGKIIERSRFQLPFPGHEVTTRTRRGDIQRFKIFITPAEVVMFTTGGNGDYALGEEASRFLSSIQYTGPNKKAADVAAFFKPDYGGYRIKFPGQLVFNTTDNSKGFQHLAVSQTQTDSAAYFLYRTDYHDTSYIEEDTFELNIISERITEQFTQKPLKRTLLPDGSYPALDFSFRADKDSAWYFMRITIDGPHYYLIGCRKKTNARPDAFFDSFSIEPTAYPEGFSIRTDTFLHFQANRIREPERPGKALAARLQSIMDEFKRKRNRMVNEEEVPVEQEDKYANINSPLTGEEIFIRLHEAGISTTLPTIDSFKYNVQAGLTRKNKMNLLKSRWEERDGILSGHFLLEDTNSTRGIRAAVFVVNRKIWRLYSTINLKAGESAFVRNFFDSFKPDVTPDGTSLFGKKNLTFLDNLYATDSLKRIEALNTLRKSNYRQWPHLDLGRMKAVIEHPGFDKLKFRDRRILILLLANTDQPEAAAWLKQFFKRSADSVRYQTAVLETLSAMQRKTSFEALFDLWPSTAQPHFLDNESESVFSSLNDTLELTAQFAAKLLPLVSLEGPREATLTLLENLAYKGLLDPRVSRKIHLELLQETGWLLSKYRFRKEIFNDRKESSTVADYDIQELEQPILRNLDLMGPFLEKSAAVKALAAQAIQYGSEPLKIGVYGLFLRYNIPIAPETLLPYSKKDKTRYLLYQQIAQAGRLSEYDTWFRDTTALIRSYLVSNKSDGYGARNPDTVRFLSRHRYFLFNRPAVLYFFEVKQKDDKDWGLAQVIVSNDPQIGNLEPGFSPKTRYGYRKRLFSYRYLPQIMVMDNLKGAEQAQYIRKKIGELRFVNRQRYLGRSDGRYYSPGTDE